MSETIHTGILGDTSKEAWAEARRQNEEQRRADAEYVERLADQQRLLDRIDAAFEPHICEQLEVMEKAKQKAVKRNKKRRAEDRIIFEEFRKYCSTAWNPPLPALPAAPAAVAAFLTKEFDRGAAHFMKRLRAISRTHVSVGLPDPAKDVLLQSLVRLIHNSKEGQP